MSETIYTPESQLKHPLRLFQAMVKDLLASRELAWRLFIRNISALYRQTILGYAWAFLPPIVTTATFVFLNQQKILVVNDTNIPYPAYVFIGTLLWQGFVDTLNSPIKLVLSSKSILVKINFPREALIIAGLGEVLFNFLIRLLLLIAVFVWYKISVPFTTLFAPIGLISLMTTGLTIGILLVPLAILYQDIEKSLTIITSIWFFLTPVIYPPPSSWPASLLTKLNPISTLIITTRDWLTIGKTTDLTSFFVIFGLSLVILLIGWVFYRISMPHIIARISA